MQRRCSSGGARGETGARARGGRGFPGAWKAVPRGARGHHTAPFLVVRVVAGDQEPPRRRVPRWSRASAGSSPRRPGPRGVLGACQGARKPRTSADPGQLARGAEGRRPPQNERFWFSGASLLGRDRELSISEGGSAPVRGDVSGSAARQQRGNRRRKLHGGGGTPEARGRREGDGGCGSS